jgi:sec-independent protein translocase protein TatC
MVDTPMPLTAHLTELRSRLFVCVIALGIGFFLCYGFKASIVASLQSPLSRSVFSPVCFWPCR